MIVPALLRDPPLTPRFALIANEAPERTSSVPATVIDDPLAIVKEPRGPSHGFDERTWLRRRGVPVVLRVDEWRVVGRRGVQVRGQRYIRTAR